MTLRIQPIFAGIGMAVAIAILLALAVPQMVAAQPAPVIVETVAAPESVPFHEASLDDASVDMNHWQETGGNAPSPFRPRRKP